MDIRRKIEKFKKNLGKSSNLRLAVLSGAMAVSGSMSAQNLEQFSQDKAENPKEQSVKQVADNKNFSMEEECIQENINEFIKNNNLPEDGFEYSSIIKMDNGLLIGFANTDDDLIKCTIWDKDETGKAVDVSAKYLDPKLEYLLSNSILHDVSSEENGKAMIFHKDKTVAVFSQETLPSDVRVTPKCLLSSVRIGTGISFDEMKSNLYYFMPAQIRETMIFEDGSQTNLPIAFRASQINEDGNLVTFPVSEKEHRDFCLNSVFKEGAQSKVDTLSGESLQRLKQWVVIEGCPGVVGFFDKFDTAESKEVKDYFQQEANFINLDEIYNYDNLKKFSETHQKIVNPSKTLQLTPQHFHHNGR